MRNFCHDKNPPLNSPSKYKPPPGACTWKIALKDKVKQSKNGKFTSNFSASPTILKRKFSPVANPLQKKAPQKGPGLISEFYGISKLSQISLA